MPTDPRGVVRFPSEGPRNQHPTPRTRLRRTGPPAALAGAGGARGLPGRGRRHAGALPRRAARGGPPRSRERPDRARPPPGARRLARAPRRGSEARRGRGAPAHAAVGKAHRHHRAGVLGRARRRAAPLLQPVPAGLRADRRCRAPASPCAQLGPRSRPRRVPPRAPRLRPVGLPRDAARARQLCAAARLPRRAAHQHADRLDRRAALRAQEGGRHAARSPGAGDAARAAFRRYAMTRSMRCLAALAFLFVVGCAGPTVVDEARKQFNDGNGAEALALLQQAAKQNPNDLAVRGEYFRLRELMVAQWLAQAEVLRQAGQYEGAEALYRRVQTHDASNSRAAAGLAQIEADRRHRALVATAEQLVKAGKYREAQDVLRPVLTENPQQRDARRLQRTIDDKLVKPVIVTVQLRPSILKPISIELRDVTVRNVFEVLQRASGINFVFDRDVRTDQRTSIALRDATIEDAIRMALLTNQLEQKVLNENTVFVFPNTPQTLREYQELVVKGFYLANADVKQTANMIRTLVKTRDVFIDEKINLLVIKDTPAAIRLAERLIAAQDLAEPEVMLEVDVLEVTRNRLLELGIRYPQTLAVGLVGGGAAGTGGTPGSVTLREWHDRNADLVRLTFTDPLFLFSLHQHDDRTNVLANPRIRVKNKEKARIHIGDRVPVITTTAAATGGFVSESVTYLDVGLKLEVEPQIFLEDEVGIKVGLEVSNIVREVRSNTSTSGGGSLTYQIGTRNATTNLRLHDGETQVLAGLISDEDRRSADRVPGLGDLPIAERLFSSTSDTTSRTEIVLLITPRLQRTLARPDAGSVEFAAGTEASTGIPRLGSPAPVFTPAEPAATSPAIPQGEAPATQPPAAPVLVPFGGVKPSTQ